MTSAFSFVQRSTQSAARVFRPIRRSHGRRWLRDVHLQSILFRKPFRIRHTQALGGFGRFDPKWQTLISIVTAENEAVVKGHCQTSSWGLSEVALGKLPRIDSPELNGNNGAGLQLLLCGVAGIAPSFCQNLANELCLVYIVLIDNVPMPTTFTTDRKIPLFALPITGRAHYEQFVFLCVCHRTNYAALRLPRFGAVSDAPEYTFRGAQGMRLRVTAATGLELRNHFITNLANLRGLAFNDRSSHAPQVEDHGESALHGTA